MATPQTAPQPVSDKENPGGFLHIPALDGIRGLAILLVLIDHLLVANNTTGSRALDILAQIRSSTFCGVNLFFALSGFLITGILLDTLNVPHFFKTFYARRTLRIFPLYYGSLIALLLLTRPMHFDWAGWQIYFLTYSSNLALWRTAPLRLGFFNINHFWSLQVEEQFYLVWPLVVFRVRRPESLVRISLLGAAAVLALRIVLTIMRGHPGFTNQYLLYSPTFSCVDNILWGCCLCALLRSQWRTTVVRLAPRLLAVAASILLVAGIHYHGLDGVHPEHGDFNPTLGYSLIGLSCAAIIAMTLQPGSRTQRFFNWRFLRFFGKYSYGIYVFHYSLDGALSGRIRALLNAQYHSKAFSVLASALIVGTLSVLVALLSYHLYEVQFLKLKRFFSYNRAATTVTISEPA